MKIILILEYVKIDENNIYNFKYMFDWKYVYLNSGKKIK